MLAYRVMPFVVMLCGCGAQVTNVTKEGQFGNIQGTEYQAELAQYTLDTFRNIVEVDASRIDLAFADDYPTMQAACGSLAACTTPEVNSYTVTTFWPEHWSEGHPYMLAHELCHVHYCENGEGCDPQHTHTECFDRKTGFAAEVAQIVTRDYQSTPPASD